MDTMDNMDTIVHVQMDYIRNRIDNIVDDPSTAEGLKPWYRQVSLCSYTYIHTYIHTYMVPTGESFSESRSYSVLRWCRLYPVATHI